MDCNLVVCFIPLSKADIIFPFQSLELSMQKAAVQVFTQLPLLTESQKYYLDFCERLFPLVKESVAVNAVLRVACECADLQSCRGLLAGQRVDQHIHIFGCSGDQGCKELGIFYRVIKMFCIYYCRSVAKIYDGRHKAREMKVGRK